MMETKTLCLILLSILLLAFSSYHLYKMNQDKKEHFESQLAFVDQLAGQGAFYDDTIANISLTQGISRNKINNIN